MKVCGEIFEEVLITFDAACSSGLPLDEADLLVMVPGELLMSKRMVLAARVANIIGPVSEECKSSNSKRSSLAGD